MPLSFDQTIAILKQYAELATANNISLKTGKRRFPAIKISLVTTDGQEHTGFYGGQIYDYTPERSLSGGKLSITDFSPYSVRTFLIYRSFDFSHIESITPVSPEHLAIARAIIAQYKAVTAPVLTIAQKVTLAKEKMEQGDVKGAESLQYEVLRDIRSYII